MTVKESPHPTAHTPPAHSDHLSKSREPAVRTIRSDANPAPAPAQTPYCYAPPIASDTAAFRATPKAAPARLLPAAAARRSSTPKPASAATRAHKDVQMPRGLR